MTIGGGGGGGWQRCTIYIYIYIEEPASEKTAAKICCAGASLKGFFSGGRQNQAKGVRKKQKPSRSIAMGVCWLLAGCLQTAVLGPLGPAPGSLRFGASTLFTRYARRWARETCEAGNCSAGCNNSESTPEARRASRAGNLSDSWSCQIPSFSLLRRMRQCSYNWLARFWHEGLAASTPNFWALAHLGVWKQQELAQNEFEAKEKSIAPTRPPLRSYKHMGLENDIGIFAHTSFSNSKAKAFVFVFPHTRVFRPAGVKHNGAHTSGAQRASDMTSAASPASGGSELRLAARAPCDVQSSHRRVTWPLRQLLQPRRIDRPCPCRCRAPLVVLAFLPQSRLL